jgi:hypothetical protein
MIEINTTQSINAAFDSVNLINQLNALEALNEVQTDRKQRNISHLQLMMSKDWFVEALTEEQTTQINAVI